MTNLIYYAIAGVNESLSASVLPDFLQKHTYKAESVSAWLLLIEKFKQVFNEQLPAISFLESGKPIIENGYISLSHSNGVVAVCFSKTANVGIDVELIKNQIPTNASRFLREDTPSAFYKKWTEREAVIKAKNYSLLKRKAESEFEGKSEVVVENEKAFSLSIYGENATFIKV